MNRFIAAIAAAVLALSCIAPALAYTQEQQTELQIGQQEYQQLLKKGEIIRSSPYYTTLDSIAARITPVADRRYFVPFHFVLVNQSDPNAFAVPGGNVYVTTAMMKFVHNKEELAGVLCHEVSHDIHHDVYNLYVKDQRLSLYATGLSLLLGGGRSPIANTIIGLAANLESLKFSRQVEHNADHTGAYICAQSGISPWGMVWLMKQFEASPTSNPPEFLSDHPSDSHRVEALESEFAAAPATFSKFNSNIACATPLGVSGWNDEYKGGCGRRQSSASRAPAKSRSAPKCPPNWKFCRERSA